MEKKYFRGHLGSWYRADTSRRETI